MPQPGETKRQDPAMELVEAIRYAGYGAGCGGCVGGFWVMLGLLALARALS